MSSKNHLSIGLSLFTLALSGCGGDALFPLYDPSTSATPGSTSTVGFAITAPDIQSDLAQTQSHAVTIASTDYTGNVVLSVDRSDLDANYSANSDIVISAPTTPIQLTAGQLTTVNLNINVLASAPSFDSTTSGGLGHIIINAIRSDNQEVGSFTVPVTVDPIFDINLAVAGGGSGTHTWDHSAMESFRQHSGNLTIRFINTDMTTPHRVHSSGQGFVHQPTNAVAGGTYEVTVDQTANDTTYYCHDHENQAANGRILSFGN